MVSPIAVELIDFQSQSAERRPGFGLNVCV
jgi:hypothetical protein